SSSTLSSPKSPPILISAAWNPATAGIQAVFYKNSANPKAGWPKQRQLQIPETARTAGGCDCPGAQKRQGFLLLSLSSFGSAPKGPEALYRNASHNRPTLA